MHATLGVQRGLFEDLATFLTREGIEISPVVADEGAPYDVELSRPEERRDCDAGHLYAGGRISCPLARNLAERFALPARQFGSMLNFLQIKIKECELGCF
jgi:hypothetical protein